MRHFLQYWLIDQAEYVGQPLNHAASGQYRRIALSRGDMLWIATIRNYRLKLMGRLVVDSVANQRKAEELLGPTIFEAEWHALAVEDTVQPIREIDIHGIAEQVRFNSPKDRLSLDTLGRVDGKQLQSIRELTSPSAQVLNNALEQENATQRNPNWSRDEVILALDTYFRFNPSRIHQHHPAVVELSSILNTLGERLGRKVNRDFRNPNAVYMKLCNFLHLDPTYQGTGLSSVSSMDKDVWEHFSTNQSQLRGLAESIRAVLISNEALTQTGTGEDEDEFPEGALKFRQHSSRERNRELVRRAKALAKARDGRLSCGICGFDYEATYGQIGAGYIECHHTVPVSELTSASKTKINDVALLCANCHRMVHRKRPWLRIEELRLLLEVN